MTMISDRVIAFAHDSFIDHIENLLDDPSWPTPGQHMSKDEVRVYFDEQRALAADLGLDFDALVKEHANSQFEIERLTRLETEVRR